MAGKLWLAANSNELETPVHGSPGQLAVDARSPLRAKPIKHVALGEHVFDPSRLIESPEAAAGAFNGPFDRLTLEMHAPTGVTYSIELLRPERWCDEQGALPGQSIYIAIPDMGVDGSARVHGREPWVGSVGAGAGLVTGRFTYTAPGDLVDVYVDGLDEPIRCTADHPFWSADRRDFVSAGQLRRGETLVSSSESRWPTVGRVVPRAGPARVYNIEVDGQHMYAVSAFGLVVHNQSAAVPQQPGAPRGTLPRQPNGNYTPDPKASGAHTVLGQRTNPKTSPKPYTQGATFDVNGTFVGRTDVTDHGRRNHVDPHFHPATSPNSVGPGQPIPSIP
jgi:hypothetical protein